MSSVTQRTVTTVRHEYAVRSPAAWADVSAAMREAMVDLPEERKAYDDACTVEARDDEIVVWWDEVPSRV